ncbi:hypothetical protein J0H58_16825 [bacterium]|nr:hypothetical protein [bacterium]
MHRLSRFGIERLEDRANPAVVASVTPEGDLLVTGSTNPGQVAVVFQTAPNHFRVEEGGQLVGEFDVTRDVVAEFGEGHDQFDVVLNGFTAPRDIRLDLGGGSNGTIVGYGTARNVTVRAGGAVTDVDGVYLSFLQTTGRAAVDLGDAPSGPGIAGDVVKVTGSQFGTDLVLTNVEDLEIRDNTTIGRDLFIATAAGTDTNIAVGAAVGRNLAVVLGGGADDVALTGSVGGAAVVSLGAGDDELEAGAGVGTLLALGGSGTDTFLGDPDARGVFLFGFEL